MKHTFHIVLNMKTLNGFETIGKFCIGNNHDASNSVFELLHGTEVLQEADILHMDLVETIDSLPVNIRVISCTLEEFAGNCKLITKELFKLVNLGDHTI